MSAPTWEHLALVRRELPRLTPTAQVLLLALVIGPDAERVAELASLPLSAVRRVLLEAEMRGLWANVETRWSDESAFAMDVAAVSGCTARGTSAAA